MNRRTSGTLDEPGNDHQSLRHAFSTNVPAWGLTMCVPAAIKAAGSRILDQNSGVLHKGWRIETRKAPISSASYTFQRQHLANNSCYLL